MQPSQDSIKSDFVNFCKRQNSATLNFKRRSLSCGSIAPMQQFRNFNHPTNISESNLTRTKSFTFRPKKSDTTPNITKMSNETDSSVEFCRQKRPSRKYGTIMRKKAATLGKSLSFRGSRKISAERVEPQQKSVSTGERPRKFSIRKKPTNNEILNMEYREKALEILDNTQEKVPKKCQKETFKYCFSHHLKP